ncbi:MAG: retropepsin-like domain-containing protein [Acidobacteriia bacterium]|nr:retropepsin-like domain-containing protein [Terriglobia bacterium]
MIRLLALMLMLAARPAGAADDPHQTAFDLQGNVIFVKASIGGSAPLDMALDSGTVRTTLDERVAAKLGMDLSMKAQSSGAKGTEEVSVIKDQTLHFCGMEIAEPLMLSYPLDFLSERVGRRVDGIIGVELLRKYSVEIDYPARRIRVYAPEAFTYAGPGEALPVTYDRRLPLVAGSVTPFGRDAIPVRFQVDTGGARAQVMFWKGFIEKYGLAAGARDVKAIEVTGFTGTTTQKQGRVQAIRIGKIVVPEPEVGLNDFQYGDPTVFDANLGSGFLKQFRVIFDLPHDRMILEGPKE